MRLLLIGALLLISHAGHAQDREPATKLFNDSEYGFVIRIPESWYFDHEEGYALTAIAPDDSRLCTVRQTTDVSFQITTTDELIAQTTPSQVLAMATIGYNNSRVHVHQEDRLGDQKALHYVYSGEVDNQYIATAVFQTINGGNLFTLSCLGPVELFSFDYLQFRMIADTFRIR